MIKSNNFIIPLVVYPFDVMVSIGQTDEELFKQLNKYEITAEDLENARYSDRGLGRYCLFECGASLIRVKHRPKTPNEYGTLHHEIFHVISAVMWKIGMQLKISISDEAYAYLLDYLTTEIYKKLK